MEWLDNTVAVNAPAGGRDSHQGRTVAAANNKHQQRIFVQHTNESCKSKPLRKAQELYSIGHVLFNALYLEAGVYRTTREGKCTRRKQPAHKHRSAIVFPEPHRSGIDLESMPSKTSVLRFRSCASSRSTTLYFRSRMSDVISRRRTPSVMNFTRVFSPTPDAS